MIPFPHDAGSRLRWGFSAHGPTDALISREMCKRVLTCSRCGEPRNRIRRGNSYCKSCHRIYVRERRAARKAVHGLLLLSGAIPALLGAGT